MAEAVAEAITSSWRWRRGQWRPVGGGSGGGQWRPAGSGGGGGGGGGQWSPAGGGQWSPAGGGGGVQLAEAVAVASSWRWRPAGGGVVATNKKSVADIIGYACRIVVAI